MTNKELLSLKHIKELKLETLAKMTDLATAGFGIVAALAWNEAIQSLVNKFLPKSTDGGLIAQITYAVIITIVVVFVTMRLGRMTGKVKEELEALKKPEEKK
jgi:hypothetical protein